MQQLLNGRKEVSQELDDIAGGKKFADMATAVYGDKYCSTRASRYAEPFTPMC